MAFGATAVLDDFQQAVFVPPGGPTVADKYADFVNGNDLNPGTLASPYKTVDKLIHNLTAGQVGMLRAGAYANSPEGSGYVLNTGTVANGTANSKIVLMAYPGETVIIRGHNYIQVGTQHWRFINLQFNSLVGGRVMELHGDFCSFEDCSVTNNHIGGNLGSSGWTAGWNGGSATSTGCLFLRCTFKNIGAPNGHYDHGIYIERSDGMTFENCRFWDCTGGWAIQIYPNCQNTKVRFCTIDGNHGGIVFGNESGYTASGHTIEENLITNNGPGVAGGSPSSPAAGYNVVTFWGVPPGTSAGNVWFNDIFNGSPANFSTSQLTLTSNDNVDPLYTNRGANDYTLQAASTQRGRGYEWRYLDTTKWQPFGSFNMLRAIFDRLGVPKPGSATKAAYLTAPTFGPNCEFFVPIGVLGAVGDTLELIARQNGSTATEGYSVKLTINSGNDTLELYRNGVLLGAADTTRNFAAGDSLGIEVDKDNLLVKAMHKVGVAAWTQVFTRTITDITTQAGNVAIKATGAFELDQTNGGAITTTPPVEPPPGGTSEVNPVTVRTIGEIVGNLQLAATDLTNLQHQRWASVTLGAGASADVDVTWPRAFPDTNYTVNATAHEPTAAETSIRVEKVVSKTTTTVKVRVVNAAGGSRTCVINCIGIHDTAGG